MNDSTFPQIPGYRIERELGQGGMARVYLAHEEKLERQVALKILKKSLTEEEGLTARFLKEAKVSASLRHSGIITIHDVGAIGDLYYFTMEYLEQSLKERIHAGPLPPQAALTILRSLAQALDYAHGKGLIHRDIKPDNIMFREDGSVVLSDFGIAKAVGSTTKLTKTGMSIGTPHYMSPEQVRGKELDGRSDLYSLGIVFHEMLTGRVPYEAEDSIAIAVKHIQEPTPELPPHLSQYQVLLNKLLAKDPSDRFQSGAELVDSLNSPDVGAGLASARYPSPATAKPSRVTRHPSPGPQTRLVTNPESPIPNPDSSARKRNLTIGLGIALAVLVVILIAVLRQGKSEGQSVLHSLQPSIDLLGIEMVRIPGGSFQMGSDSSEAFDDEKPVHSVTVSSFFMSKTEITQGQWQAVMGNNPSGSNRGDNYPVENVSWDDAQEFIRKLNQQTGKNYRLPTEAEWEYAARGGSSSDRYGNLDSIAWYEGNSGGSSYPVGQKQANPYGLYDMLGNVWEWVQDWKGDYSSYSQDNPTGPSSGSYRVSRGGSWCNWARSCRAPFRSGYPPDGRYAYLGFRLAAVSL